MGPEKIGQALSQNFGIEGIGLEAIAADEIAGNPYKKVCDYFSEREGRGVLYLDMASGHRLESSSIRTKPLLLELASFRPQILRVMFDYAGQLNAAEAEMAFEKGADIYVGSDYRPLIAVYKGLVGNRFANPGNDMAFNPKSFQRTEGGIYVPKV